MERAVVRPGGSGVLDTPLFAGYDEKGRSEHIYVPDLHIDSIKVETRDFK